MTRVLVVDDEPEIGRALRVGLGARGFDVRTVGNGETAIEAIAVGAPDVVVLDLGLPGIGGVEVIRRLRAWTPVPIIVLSVRDAQSEKVRALDAGADDYVTKPFGLDELLARMRAVLRRAPDRFAASSVAFGEIEVDFGKRLVRRRGEPVHLTPTEWDLLQALASHPGKLLTHRWLMMKVWGAAGGTDSLRLYVLQLRRKLEDEPSRPRWILTEPGVGYRWAEPVSEGGTARS